MSAFAVADEEPRLREYQVREAVERLRADPLLAKERTVRRLEWVRDDSRPPSRPGWVSWIGDLFDWLAELSRVLVWLLIAALVAVLVILAVRLARSASGAGHGGGDVIPTHVHDLDIRPESLPDDVGAAAWGLWESGRHREALALLYRGLLSRLVHVHQVPIRDSSTEGDSLALSERHLPASRHGYVGLLVRTWQRAVYGGRPARGDEVRQLCEQFAAALSPVGTPAGAAP